MKPRDARGGPWLLVTAVWAALGAGCGRLGYDDATPEASTSDVPPPRDAARGDATRRVDAGRGADATTGDATLEALPPFKDGGARDAAHSYDGCIVDGGAIHPFEGGVLTTYPLGDGSGPWGLTTGLDGSIWFTEVEGNRIGVITPECSVHRYSIHTDASTASPRGIVMGSDKAIWFAENRGNSIGRFSDGGFSRPLSVEGGPWELVQPPGDAALEFTVPDASGIGYEVDGSAYPLPHSFTDPWGIIAISHGMICVSQKSVSNVSCVTAVPSNYSPPPVTTPGSGGPAPAEIGSLPEASAPYGVTFAMSRLWVAVDNPSQIASFYVTDSGVLSDASLYPTQGDAGPYGIAASDSGIWFTEHNVDQLGRLQVSSDGSVTIHQYPLRDAGALGPTGIVVDAEGDIWFAAHKGNLIGRLHLH